jgi:pimeloyl-ACP methyl ester carboxylesterase
VIPPLADAGYHVLAPDLRGYGKTTGWRDSPAESYRMLDLVQDCVALLSSLKIKRAHVVGHDFGAPLAAYCALTRPDVFRSVVLMSSPFGGPPAKPTDPRIHDELAALGRKHYQWYYSTPEANADMQRCPQGVHAFLRAYYHVKSADWPDNKPYALASWSAAELAKLPTYYVMRLSENMAQTVAPHLPPRPAAWLTDEELAVYAAAFETNGFQGGLNWYRCSTSAELSAPLRALAGRTIDVPAMYIAGAADWGIHQFPGAFERMQSSVCTRMAGCHLVPGAGHWVQQEQPARTAGLLLDFLAKL